MKRILKYGIVGCDDLMRIDFEDNDLPITITPPNRPDVKVTCGDETILGLTGVSLDYIEIN